MATFTLLRELQMEKKQSGIEGAQKSYRDFFVKISPDTLKRLYPEPFDDDSNNFLHGLMSQLDNYIWFRDISIPIMVEFILYTIGIYHKFDGLKIKNSRSLNALDILLENLSNGIISNNELHHAYLRIIAEFCKYDGYVATTGTRQYVKYYIKASQLFCLFFQNIQQNPKLLTTLDYFPVNKPDISYTCFHSLSCEQQHIVIEYINYMKECIKDLHAWYAAIYICSGRAIDKDDLVRVRFLTGASGLRPNRVRIAAYLVSKISARDIHYVNALSASLGEF